MNEMLMAVKRTACLHWLATSVLGVLCLGLIALNFKLAADLNSLARHQPIHVIPGAAEGVYAPGLTRYNVANAARYLLGLGVNVTPATAARRFAELETYIDPEALAQFRSERDRRLKEITAQQQSRAFFPDEADHLSAADGLYVYRARGSWEIYSGSLPLSTTRQEFVLRFRVGHADKENPYGIFVRGFEVHPIPGATDHVRRVATSP